MARIAGETQKNPMLHASKDSTVKKHLSLEQLGQRDLMSAFFNIPNRTLYITGTPQQDDVTVYVDEHDTPGMIDDEIVVAIHTLGGESETFRFDRYKQGGQHLRKHVRNIEISTGDGSDNIDNSTILPSKYFAGNGDDSVLGSYGSDTIYGGNGNDYLKGRDGDDVIEGGNNDDTLSGEEGNDVVNGSSGNDTLWGDDDFMPSHTAQKPGNDTLSGGSGFNIMHGQAGNDKLYGGNGGNQMFGGHGDDWMVGGSLGDQMEGGDGTDYMFGKGGDDVMWGDWQAEGEDDFVGGAADYMEGGSGVNTMYGQVGNDNMIGGNQGNYMHGGYGDDYIKGGSGIDHLQGGIGSDHVWGYGGDDFLGDKNWSNPGDNSSDYLNGGTGYDILVLGYYDIATNEEKKIIYY